MAKTIYRIHPAIGVARVGDANRETEGFFFIGPERPGVPANFNSESNSFETFKVGGRIKPQAARFRIFEILLEDDSSEKVVQEVTLKTAGVTAITWSVHVANRKASFVNFTGLKGSRDIPFYSKFGPDESRNERIRGVANRRAKLDLDSGVKSIAGGQAGKVELAILGDPATRLKKIKTLGELRSDGDGRLIFIGGMGHAESEPGLKVVPPRSQGAALPVEGVMEVYNNNEGWFDDVSDGPVHASLTVHGKTFDAEGAWVMVGPPDFVPAVQSYRTMYDTMADLFVRDMGADDRFKELPEDMKVLREIWLGREEAVPKTNPSFNKHILPVLLAMSKATRFFAEKDDAGKAYHTQLGPKDYDLLGGEEFDSGTIGKIFSKLRDPGKPENDAKLMPKTHGDGYGGEVDITEGLLFHSLSPMQYLCMKHWSNNKFLPDWDGKLPLPDADITPAGLDRAALDAAIGGAFYPGIEAGWLVTFREVYRSVLRFAEGAEIGVQKVHGETPDTFEERTIVVEAGFLSQQMAQPWHADFMDCAKDGDVAWWPVQRPDSVVPEGSGVHVEWVRDMPGIPAAIVPTPQSVGHLLMAHGWSSRGFVVQTGGDLFEVEGPSPAVG